MKQKELKSIMKEVTERSNHYDKETDQILINGKIETYETYFNTLNRLFTSDIYKEDNNPGIIYDRRLSLQTIFGQRVIFLLNERLEIVKNYLSNYGIICNVTASDIIKTDCRIINLDTYDRYICNPVAAGDFALIINSVIFNNIMSFRDLSYEQNGVSYKDIFEITNNILNIALLDFVHMFNLLYLEADEVYYPAGILNEAQPEQVIALEGDERARVLTEMARPDLIETDIQVGRV